MRRRKLATPLPEDQYRPRRSYELPPLINPVRAGRQIILLEKRRPPKHIHRKVSYGLAEDKESLLTAKWICRIHAQPVQSELARNGLKPELTAFYQNLAKRLPESNAPQKALKIPRILPFAPDLMYP